LYKRKFNPYKIRQTSNIIKLKTAYTEWKTLLNHDLDLTIKPIYDLQKSDADKLFAKFWNIVDQEVYGNRRRRFRVSIERMMTTERGIPTHHDDNGNWSGWHQHGTVKMPPHITFEKLRIILERSLKKCAVNGTIQLRKLEPQEQVGWTEYTQKQYDEKGDAFSPFTSHLNITKYKPTFFKLIENKVRFPDNPPQSKY